MKGQVSSTNVGGGRARTYFKQKKSMVNFAFEKECSGFREGYRDGDAGDVTR